jgi:ubiquinone/menaquinone biosynthesis C-methylase UbiE
MKTEATDFEQLMRLSRGFQGAKVLLAACELDLFTPLSSQARGAAELAAELKLDARRLAILMDALVALGLLNKQQGKYSNTPLAATYLVKGSPDYRGHILRHIDNCWDNWSQLTQVIRHGKSSATVSPSPLTNEEEYNREFIWGMDDLGRDQAQVVLKHLDLSGTKHMLDLGGGAATYAIAFVKKYPELRARVFDLPLTLKVAQENIDKHGVQDRVKTKIGDFFQDELGQGYDLVWISQILHAHSELKCKQLIEKTQRALEPGGRLIIHDFLISEERTAPVRSALFAVHMAVATEEGRAYTPAEIMNWLQAAGFINVGWKQVSDHNMLVEGTKQ